MTESFPPPDFIPAKSAVPGIIVYKPKPPEDEKEVVNFNCPNCTATTAFNTDDGGLTCAHCGYHKAPKAVPVGRAAEEFEFTVETLQQAVHGWGEARKELVCNHCNVHTTLSINNLTYLCPFCGSNKVVQMKAVQDVLRPRFIIPFSVTTEQCQTTTAVWLQDSWMLPEKLMQLGQGTEYVPIYLPFWTFDARAYADWKAEERRGSGDSATWKKIKGKVQIYFDDLIVCGSRHIDRQLINQIKKFDMQALVDYKPDFLAGIQAQAYEIPLDEAWAEARQRMRLRTKKECQERIQRRFRNFQMAIDFQDESWRYVLLPVYMATFSFGKTQYQVLINGQTGKIAGRRPVDWRKVATWIATLWLPAFLLALVSLYLEVANLPDWVQGSARFLFILIVIYLLFSAVYVISILYRGIKMQAGKT